jgi:hypothetical protein
MPSFMTIPSLPSALTGGALLALPLALTLGLSACGGPDLPKFPPACPQTGIISDAADVTTFRGNGTDLTDMVVDGQIKGISGKCQLNDLTHLHTTISVNLDLTRGPASSSRTVPVSYFVSVSRGDTVLDKQIYTIPVAFPSNTDHVQLTGDQIDMVLPVDQKLSGAAYRVLIGFQLTPAELEFNRRRGPR